MNADEQIRQDREILRAASKDSDDWDDATWAAWWRTAERHDPHFARKVTTAAAVAAQGALPVGSARSTDDVLADYAALDFAALMDPDAAAVVTAVCDPLVAEIKRLTARVADLQAERHDTNEALDGAAETLRANRDRIAELEKQVATSRTGALNEAADWFDQRAAANDIRRLAALTTDCAEEAS